MRVQSALILALALSGTGLLQAQAPAALDPKAIMAKATDDLIKSGQVERALHQGQEAPDFALPDANGHSVRLSDLLKKGPVILTFYRGGWCPFCNTQLRSYQAHLAEFRAKGIELVAVSPQLPEYTLSTAEKDALTFPVLSDVGNAVARSYGLVFTVSEAMRGVYVKFGVDLKTRNGDGSWELPMPGTFLIGPGRKVLLAYVNADYTKRMPVEGLLDALK